MVKNIQIVAKWLIAYFMLVPPTRSCVDPGCTRRVRGTDQLIERDLTKGSTFAVTVFTRDLGPVPGRSFSQYCDGEFRLSINIIVYLTTHHSTECNTRYHPTFYIHRDASTRTYYQPDTVEFIGAGQHLWLERSLCELFATMMMASQ
jgi:hypothetical protein